MLDGFQYVLGQIGVVLVITALIAATLGWFLGRGSRRRNEAALERALGAITRPEADASAFAPTTARSDDAETVGLETADLDEDVEFPTHRLPYGAALIDHVPLHADNPDGTVIRPEPDATAGDEEGTVLRPVDSTVLRAAPDATVIRPVQEGTVIRPVPDGTVIRPPAEATVLRPAPDGTVLRPASAGTVLRPAPEGTVIRPAPEGTVIRPAATPYVPSSVIRSVPGISQRPGDAVPGPLLEDASSLRPDLHDPDLQIGRIEAAALAAWDRTVPMLEQQVKELAAQNDDLRLRLCDLQDRLDMDATSRLRAVAPDHGSEERRARA